MNTYQIVTFSNPPEFHFEYRTAAYLASVSTEFISRCEHEELISCRIMMHGQKGLSVAEVKKLKLIRHLHEDMGLALDAVDFLLRYRNRLKTMQSSLDEMKQQMRDRERRHEAEIHALRLRLIELSASE